MASDETQRPDLCIIGTDPVGLDLALAAAGLGYRVAIITASTESPSPALIRARALGAALLAGTTRFLSPKSLEAGGVIVMPRFFALATGAAAEIPPIAEIETIPVWDETSPPAPLLILGSTAEAARLAEAALRQGGRAMIACDSAFPAGFDAETGVRLRIHLQRAGVTFVERARLAGRIVARDAGFEWRGGTGSGEAENDSLPFSHLALATSLLPKLDGLELEKADIRRADGRLVLDDAFRTSNPRVFALGLASGEIGRHHGKTQIAAALSALMLGKPRAPSPALYSRHVQTEPGIAEIGLREADIPTDQRADYRYYRASLAEAGGGEGHVKALVGTNGALRGVSIYGARAGELILPFQLAMQASVKLHDLARLPVAAPGAGDALTQIARLALRDRLKASRWLQLMRWLRVIR